MTDYKQTRDAAGIITSRFDRMLLKLSDDYEDEITVVSLMRYYDLCCEPNKDEGGELIDPDTTILEAIERVLEDFMCKADYSDWLLTVKDKNLFANNKENSYAE
jgi:hypothetical protein